MRSFVSGPQTLAEMVAQQMTPVNTPGAHLLFHNAGSEFAAQELAWPTGAVQTVDIAAAVAADVDGDGDLDLLTTTPPGILQWYRNDTPGLGHFLRVRIGGGALAEGAHVQIWAGGYAQERVRTTSTGAGGKQGPWLHFGLGSAAQLDVVRVIWPSGKVVELKNVAADQAVDVAMP